jgi:hypothetical protein
LRLGFGLGGIVANEAAPQTSSPTELLEGVH